MKQAFINATVLDGTRDMIPRPNHVVVTEDDRITAVRPASDPIEKDIEHLKTHGFDIIDLNGRYLMPGLINLHVHLAGSGAPKKKEQDNVAAVKLVTANPLTRAVGHAMVAGFAKTQLMSGTTTIRTVGGIADFDTQIGRAHV